MPAGTSASAPPTASGTGSQPDQPRARGTAPARAAQFSRSGCSVRDRLLQQPARRDAQRRRAADCRAGRAAQCCAATTRSSDRDQPGAGQQQRDAQMAAAMRSCAPPADHGAAPASPPPRGVTAFGASRGRRCQRSERTGTLTARRIDRRRAVARHRAASQQRRVEAVDHQHRLLPFEARAAAAPADRRRGRHRQRSGRDQTPASRRRRTRQRSRSTSQRPPSAADVSRFDSPSAWPAPHRYGRGRRGIACSSAACAASAPAAQRDRPALRQSGDAHCAGSGRRAPRRSSSASRRPPAQRRAGTAASHRVRRRRCGGRTTLARCTTSPCSTRSSTSPAGSSVVNGPSRSVAASSARPSRRSSAVIAIGRP